MRIAVSGTHFMGKSTLIEDFIDKHPHYKMEIEPYYQLEGQGREMSLEPDLDSFLEQLDFSVNQLNEWGNEQNIIFDRCPVDFLAYAMYALHQDSISIHESEIGERFSEITAALDKLDLIVFLPITKDHPLEYTEENPSYRKAIDRCFKKIYRDDIFDIFPSHTYPQIIEISGNRISRLKKLESYLVLR